VFLLLFFGNAFNRLWGVMKDEWQTNTTVELLKQRFGGENA
jgi:hypothetical protein